MSFKWDDYLRLAQYLGKGKIKECSQEAARRTAVSRAYYAAFGHARKYAQANFGFTPTQTADDHRLIRECFKRNREPNIARWLDELRRCRNSCDYNDKVRNLSEKLQQSLQNAQKIFNKLK